MMTRFGVKTVNCWIRQVIIKILTLTRWIRRVKVKILTVTRWIRQVAVTVPSFQHQSSVARGSFGAPFGHHSGIIQTSISHKSDIIPASFGDHLGITQGSFWDHSGTIRDHQGPQKTIKITKITNFHFSRWVLILSTKGIDW